jgi:heterodisulfide reductase subunit C
MALAPTQFPWAPDILEGSRDRLFTAEVCRRSGTPVQRCYQCRSCGNGCPFVEAMDYPPYAVLRLVQYGLRQPALECGAIWICAGCHTCSGQCPNGLDIAAVMNTLRHLALEERAAVAAPDILQFHLEVVRSIERHGRVHKLGVMLRHKLLTGHWFTDVDVGLKMLAKRKLDLRPSRVKNLEEIARLFRPFWRAK